MFGRIILYSVAIGDAEMNKPPEEKARGLASIALNEQIIMFDLTASRSRRRIFITFSAFGSANHNF